MVMTVVVSVLAGKRLTRKGARGRLSAANEAQVQDSLLALLHAVLAAYPTTLADDEARLAAVEAEAAAAAQEISKKPVDGALSGAAATGGDEAEVTEVVDSNPYIVKYVTKALREMWRDHALMRQENAKDIKEKYGQWCERGLSSPGVLHSIAESPSTSCPVPLGLTRRLVRDLLRRSSICSL